MIKVRLEGTKEELDEFLAGFRPGYKILNESSPYANGGRANTCGSILTSSNIPSRSYLRSRRGKCFLFKKIPDSLEF